MQKSSPLYSQTLLPPLCPAPDRAQIPCCCTSLCTSAHHQACTLVAVPSPDPLPYTDLAQISSLPCLSLLPHPSRDPSALRPTKPSTPRSRAPYTSFAHLRAIMQSCTPHSCVPTPPAHRARPLFCTPSLRPIPRLCLVLATAIPLSHLQKKHHIPDKIDIISD
ncbi:hypothetical protein SLEP1_g50227 [Rubroshorea leprosula]|uniref:Uncharacterized protein n=1 Tax=Rubroshorea leprosula TaxID=152421 RepID=A0AAV5M1D0_9ROSI|nr:hypothetical protein SLEP1_g50227 [Rubroshorea leprosula]